MSGLSWQWPLQEGETLLWQGRPAPRCYTFRNWKQAVIGTLLFLTSSFWLMLAYQLVQTEGYPWWLLLMPAPLVFFSLWFGPVSLLRMRMEWEKVFYALTEDRLLLRGGIFTARVETIPLAEVIDWQQKIYGAQLASVCLKLNNKQKKILLCLEQPQNLIAHLDREVKKPATKGDSV